MNDSDWWQLLRGWLNRKQKTIKQQVLFYDTPLRSRSNLIRRLEKRRVFSATSVFSNGVLDVQFVSGGTTDATLQADGGSFFLDTNSNNSFDGGETFGNIADLHQLNVSSPDAVGNFTWLGDFSAAPLDLPNAFGNVVQIDSIASVSLKANISVDGNVDVNVHGPIEIDEHICVEGDLSLQSLDANIVDGANARVTVEDDLLIQAALPTTLNDDSTNLWSIEGKTDLLLSSPASTRTTLVVAEAGTFEVRTVSLLSADATVFFDSGVSLAHVDVQGSFDLHATGNVTDIATSNIGVSSHFSISANSIVLGDTTTDRLNAGTLTFESSSGVQIFENSSTSLTGHSHATNLLLSSTGSISEIGPVELNITQNATFRGLSIDLGFLPQDELQFGSLTFEAQGVVSIYETGSTLLRGASSASSLILSSTGSLTNQLGASLSVTGNANFSGTSIDLSVTNLSTMQFGTLSFDSLGSVAISESSGTVLTGLSRAGSLVLQATGQITNLAGTVLIVTQNASFRGPSILLGRQSNDFFQFGSLTFSSSGTVSIAEKGAMAIAGANTAAALVLDSESSLATAQNSSLAISGNASFRSGSISIGLAGTGNVSFGSLTFNSTGDVQIEEDDATSVTGSNTARNLTLDSKGSLTNTASSRITVTESASFFATSINLGTQSSDVVNFGSLRFISSGAVTISEDSNTVLTGISSAHSLDLRSTGAITNETAARLTVLENASFTATSISLGQQASDFFSTGSLTFVATGSVRYFADSAVELAGASSASSLVLSSPLQITNCNGASLAVTQNASFSAATINLGNATADSINFGSLTFNSTNSTSISEDSSTILSGTSSALSLNLRSTGAITNEAAARLTVLENASFTAASISLGEQASDFFSTGSLTFVATGAVRYFADSAIQLFGASTANSLVLSSPQQITNASGSSLAVTQNALLSAATINLGNAIADSINFGSLTFNSTNSTSISEDSSTILSGTSSALSLNLRSTGAITNEAATRLTVFENASFTAASISLGEQASDFFSTGSLTFVATGSVRYFADSVIQLVGASTANSLVISSPQQITNASGSSLAVTQNALFFAATIDLGNAASDSINFGTLTFNSSNSTSISEDSNTGLSGTSSARSLDLRSTGAIANEAATRLTVLENASFTATSILLGEQASDFFSTGSLTFVATGSVRYFADSAIQLVGASSANSLVLSSPLQISNSNGASLAVTLNASFSAATINLGNATSDSINFGSLTFISSNSTNISEDSSTTLSGTNSARSVDLRSTGAITNEAATRLTVLENASFTATSISLGEQAPDFFSSGSLTFFATGSVRYFADSAIQLAGASSASSLVLFSPQQITNAIGSSLTVIQNALLSAATINLGNAASDSINFGSLTFNSTNSTSISEDSSTILSGTSSSRSLDLRSAGAITNEATTRLTVTENASFTATSISLGEQASDVFSTGSLTFVATGSVRYFADSAIQMAGASSANSLVLSTPQQITNVSGSSLTVIQNASLSAATINLGNATSDSINFGSLTFTSTSFTSITEDSGTTLSGTSLARSLDLRSTGAITNEAAARLAVTENASLTATSISLGEQASDFFSTGSLTFVATGSVRYFADTAIQLAGTNTANSLVLSSPLQITNANGSSLAVTQNASFSAATINLGNASSDLINFGSLTFNSTNSTNISEDSSTTLSGISSARSLDLRSTGAITNEAATRLTVLENASFTAASIALGEQASDFFSADSLTFAATGSVRYFADSAIQLVGASTANSLVLSSPQLIFNANGSSLTVNQNASLSAATIDLGNATSDSINFGTLTFNSSDSTSISEDSSTILSGISSARSLDLRSTGAIANAASTRLTVSQNAFLSGLSIDLGSSPSDEVRFGSVTFQSPGAVTFREDDSTLLTGNSFANSLELRSLGEIRNASHSQLIVTQVAFFSGNSIHLGDAADDNVLFGALTFQSAGEVVIFEDDSTLLTGANSAGSLVLKSLGSITNEPGFQLLVSGNARFSGTSISLNPTGTDNVQFGSVSFESSGSVTFGGRSSIRLSGVNSADSLTLVASVSITNEPNTSLTVNQLASFQAPSIELGIAPGDRFVFGSLNFQSTGTVVISEDDSTLLSGINSASDLTLTSLGAITNEANTQLIVQRNASFTAETISLGNQLSDQFRFGTLNFKSTDSTTLSIDSQVVLKGISSAKSLELDAPSLRNEAFASLSVVDNATLRSNFIELGTANGDSVNFGSLTIESLGTAIVSEDSDMLLVGTNDLFVARLTSTGTLSNATLSSLIVRNSVTLSASNIDLGNAANDFVAIENLTFVSTGLVDISSDATLTLVGVNTAGTLRLDATGHAIRNLATIDMRVAGNAFFIADKVDLGNQPLDQAKFGSLTFQTSRSTSISEDDDTTLTGVNFADSLRLTSTSALTNLPGSKISVTDNATLIAGSIDLGNAAGDEIRFGSLTFGPFLTFQPGNVSIHENDSTTLTGTSLANRLNLISDGDIDANPFTSLVVVTNARFEASNINLGESSLAFLRFGSLTFSSTGSVSILERDDMTLAGSNAARELQLVALGALTDESTTTLLVQETANFLSASVRLADESGDRLEVLGNAFFETTERTPPLNRGDVLIGISNGSVANFGSVGFLAGNVTLIERSPTRLDGTVVTGLNLTSTNLISATGRDTGAGVSAIQVFGPTEFHLTSSGSILLKSMIIPEEPSRDGLLLQNIFNGSITISGVTDQLLIRSLSPAAVLVGIPSQLNQLELWFPNASINLGSMFIPIGTLNVLGDMVIIAGVDAVDTSIVNYTLGDFSIPIGSISLDKAKVTVGGDATFLAFGSILVGQQRSTELKVPNGTASFISLGGLPITLGTGSPQSDGLLLLPRLALFSESIVDPLVTCDIFAAVDGSVTLSSWQVPQPIPVTIPALVANNLELVVSGWLRNESGLQIVATGNAILKANDILLASHASDAITVAGNLYASATTFVGFGIPDTRGQINIGSLGLANFGSISLLAKDATIIEDSDTIFGNPFDRRFSLTDISGRLVIESNGSITNTIAVAPFRSAGVFAQEAILKATQSIHLGFVNFGSVRLYAGANVPLSNPFLTPLNFIANRTGTAILDQLGDSLKPGISLQTKLISGETIDQVYRDFSFFSRFDVNYAVYLLDVDSLKVTEVVATGDRPHIYLETGDGQDLVIAGTILTASRTSEYGGTVVIAGGNLVFANGGSVQSAANAQGINEVLSTSLFARVFNGGEGIGGLNSTGRVLAPTGTAIDTPDFLIGRRQAVATQFGSTGERGFLTIVRYADGYSQLFDTSGEIAGTNTRSVPGSQSILAASKADNLVSVFQRSTFITDFFGQVELPTTVILRRSTDLFLFESAGIKDLNSTAIDLNSDLFGVQRVFAGLLNVSLPIISEVRVFQQPMMAPVLTFLPNVTTYTTQNDVELRTVRHNSTGEVAIYRVNFDDRNQDGQPDSNEIPDPEKVFFPTGEERDLPGEIDPKSKDTQEAAAPTADKIREWIRKYQTDPTKPAGVYSIIQNDEIRGPIVLRTFVLRDLPESSPPPSVGGSAPPTTEQQEGKERTDGQK